jgi:putative SOS response-associated peptidase YedK
MPWAASERGPTEELLRPCPAEGLEAVSVLTRITSPRNDDESIIQPGAGALKAQGTLL